MAQLQTPFDATQVSPVQGIGQLPVGNKLAVVITDSEVKATKDNSGGYVQFTVQIQQGETAGSQGAYRLNLYNASEQARKIAESQLSALCHVTGVFHLQNTQQLHNIPFLVDVEPQKENPKYTEIKRVYDIQGNEPGKAHQQAASQPQHNQQSGWSQNQQNQQNQQQDNSQQQQNQQQGNAWGAAQNNQQSDQSQQQQQQQSNAVWGNNNQQQTQQQPQNGGWSQNQQQGGGNAPWGQK